MCKKLNPSALRPWPPGFLIRTCRPDELDIWKGFPFDSEQDMRDQYAYMSEYFENVYGPKKDVFSAVSCLFARKGQT